MKELSTIKKILLSILPAGLIVLIYIALNPRITDYETYVKIWTLILILSLVQTIILSVRVIKSKIEKDKKMFYILLFISFFPFHLLYVWKVDKEIVGRISSH